MELDLKHFRQFIPINTLGTKKSQWLKNQTQLEYHIEGTQLFEVGDLDNDTLYLLQGEVELINKDGSRERIAAGSPEALHPLANLKPRRCRATIVSEEAFFARICSDLLDRMLILMPSDPPLDGDLPAYSQDRGHDALDSEWMMAIMQSPTFLRMPAANIQAVFLRMQEVPVRAGQFILRQGEQGDYYYLIKEGAASVTRHSGSTEARLATLEPPQTFGEEALLTNEPRNATVTMLTDGVLMRLAKADFDALLKHPLLNWVDIAAASELVRQGAVRVDVRSEAEYDQSKMQSALNLPLYLLRLKLSQLDKARQYILYCDNGVRSTAAGFLMTEQGFDVAVLKGGLASVQ